MKNIYYLKIYRTLIVGLLLSFAPNICFAAEEEKQEQLDPVAVLQQITAKVLNAMQDKKAEIRSDTGKLYTVVYDTVVPHIDFVEISKWVAGRKSWRKASNDQKNTFIEQFKLIIVRTYATALNKYTDQSVVFVPIKESQTFRKRMQISGEVWDSKNSKTIHVDFRVIASANTWKVYDLVVEGISLLKGFQVQFSNLIRNEGINAAIARMREHNAAVLGSDLVNAITTLSQTE